MNPTSTQSRPQQVPPQNQQQFRNKARKREAVVKYEPEVFRDALYALIPVDDKDSDAYCTALEANESKLDLKRYAEPFCEIFIVGGLLGPGGSVSIVKKQNPFAIFESSMDQIKSRVEIFRKLARRLKYIPKKLEETLNHLMTYINKFGDNHDKLAKAVGLFASAGLISIKVLDQTLKDHLVGDGSSLRFLSVVLKSYIAEQPIEHLTLSLRKAGLDWRLPEFFPPHQRTTVQLVTFFNDNGLKGLSDYYTKQQKIAVKDKAGVVLKELFSQNKSPQEVTNFLNTSLKEHGWAESEVPALMWDSLLSANDWSSRVDQLEGNLVKLLTAWGATFAQFCPSAKCELALLLHVQSFCYEDSRFHKLFRVIVQHLYKGDALSESAILYWYEKGAGAYGKTVFLTQLEPFVNWLRQQDSESDEE